MYRKFSISLLDPFGKASFVVLDTDYDNYALVCTCQDKKFLFSDFTFHRRSCTILQRTPPKAERDKASEDISKQVIFTLQIQELHLRY